MFVRLIALIYQRRLDPVKNCALGGQTRSEILVSSFTKEGSVYGMFSELVDFFLFENYLSVILAIFFLPECFNLLLSRQNSLDQICDLFARDYAGGHIVGVKFDLVDW